MWLSRRCSVSFSRYSVSSRSFGSLAMIRTSPPAPTAAYGDCTAFRLGLTESGLTWLSNLPEGTPLKTLVRLAKIRWRIEHDYRELKTGLGLDHFEGRSYLGRHGHVTLAAVAQAFCTCYACSQKRMRRPDALCRPTRTADFFWGCAAMPDHRANKVLIGAGKEVVGGQHGPPKPRH
jgi:hypothetical protein